MSAKLKRQPPAVQLATRNYLIDFSPDANFLRLQAFTKFVHKADGSAPVARLVVSERIESVQFSPDGKSLAVAGGQPGRSGEPVIWDVASRKLAVSTTTTFDTAYGITGPQMVSILHMAVQITP